MDGRFEELRVNATEHFEDIRVLFAGLREIDLPARADGRWTVRQVAAHITRAPGVDIYAVERLRRGRSATVPGFLAFAINVLNAWSIRRFGKATRKDLLGAWEIAYNDLIAYINTLDDEDLEKAGVVMGRGRLTVYEFLKQSPSHWQAHADTIRTAIGVTPPAA